MPEFTVSPYPYFFMGSFVVALAIASAMLRRDKIPTQIIVLNSMLVVLMSLFGAVMYGLIRSGFSKGILEVGFSSLGGAIGLLLACVIMGVIYPEGKNSLISAFIVVLPLMYGISKIGCFSIGCCRGIAYDGPLAIRYHNYVTQTGSVFPIQIVESITFMLIFSVAYTMYRKKKELITPVVLALCSIGKFSLDFLREEHVGKVLSTNQVVCIIFLIISALIYIIYKAKKGDIYNGT
ncbi:MAG: prolipoprotein diacylglyceryl transferase [Saccharofermentans sp.]|nr:prolipoprotein diacylglyceryl transferase [Saccharofermentans sp.]